MACFLHQFNANFERLPKKCVMLVISDVRCLKVLWSVMFIQGVQAAPIERVRAILLTLSGHLLLIKRLKPHDPVPYWVAPGGGVEVSDRNLAEALQRELAEELGAEVRIERLAFTLRHRLGEKELEEHFFVCTLLNYDLALRSGPEFADPTRGEYIPDFIPLTPAALNALNLRTPELRDWLLENLRSLKVAS